MNKRNDVQQWATIRFGGGVILALCLYLISVPPVFAGSTVEEGDELPLGTWEVLQVRLEKNTDGIIQRATINMASEQKEGIRFPQKLEIKESRQVILYYDDSKEGINAEYTLEDGQIKITSVGIILQYLYSISDEQLTLALIHRYLDRKSVSKVEDITENWTVTLQRKK